jgi:hypothetical protein
MYRKSPARRATYARVVLILLLIVCLGLIPITVIKYFRARQVLASFNSSPGCSADAPVLMAPSVSQCEIKNEKVVRRFTTHSGHHVDYWLVLRNESGQDKAVELDRKSTFYHDVKLDEQVQARTFAGEIVEVSDGANRAMTANHPQQQKDTLQLSLFGLVAFSLLILFITVRLQKAIAKN